MRGLGKYSKKGSGYIVAGVSGGACIPPLLGAAADANNHNVALAMVVPMMFFVAAESYAIAVNFVPAYRDVADKFATAEIGIRVPGIVDEETSTGVVGGDEKSAGVEHDEAAAGTKM